MRHGCCGGRRKQSIFEKFIAFLPRGVAQAAAPRTSNALERTKPMPVLKRTAAAILALATMTGPLSAAPRCATPVDEAAFRSAAIQQQLMVAALTCHNIDEYNR